MSTRAIYTNVMAAARRAGHPLPATLTQRLERVRAVEHGGLDVRAALDELVTATTTALLDGRDPATDKDVTAALTRHSLAAATNWPVALSGWAAAETHNALVEHADELLAEWGLHIGDAGAKLADALPHLDRWRSLADQAQDTARAGGKRAQAYRAAAEALEVIDSLVDAWLMLARELRLVDAGGTGFHHGRTILRSPAVTAAELGTIPANVDTWTLVGQHDVTVTGADLDDYQDALARIAAERDAAEAAFEKERTAAVGAHMRFTR